MRPDVINWQEKQECLAMTFLPRPRLHRRVWRWAAYLLVAQFVLSSAAIFALDKWSSNEVRIQDSIHQPESSQSFVRSSSAPHSKALVMNPAFNNALPRPFWLFLLIQGASVAVIFVAVAPLANRQIKCWSLGLGSLHAAIHRLSTGAEPKPVPVGGDDEIAYLLLAFNDMAGKLIHGRQALVYANEELEQRIELRTEELRQSNVQLEHKNSELAELTDTALRFTDDVAHEFRTPLTVVMEFASIIADGLGGPVTEKQSEYLQFIVSASGDLANLVDDFLDSGKLRARTLKVDRRVHCVNRILDETWPLLETRAAARRVMLHRDVDSDVSDVFCDSDKVRRTLINLVSNAIKFSKAHDTITISACNTGEGVEVAIADTGPGLTNEEANTLFQRFKQGHQGHQSTSKGFGLGLNIVRNLVNLNLGSVSVSSQIGKGSRFAFTLPSSDVRSIINSYLTCVNERNPGAVISILRVSREANHEIESIQTFLASTLYSNDIQLRDAADEALIVVGECVQPELWKNRLLCQDMDCRNLHGDSSAIPLSVTVLATCPANEAKEVILQHVLSTSELEVPAGV